jgi:hypothetical protein
LPQIDVEGAEWDSLSSFLWDEAISKLVGEGGVKQLLVEFHWDPDSRLKNERHLKIIKKISDMGFVPWHIERHEGSDCCLDIRLEIIHTLLLDLDFGSHYFAATNGREKN